MARGLLVAVLVGTDVQDQPRLHRTLLEGQELPRLQTGVLHEGQAFHRAVTALNHQHLLAIFSADHAEGAVFHAVGEEVLLVGGRVPSGLKAMLVMGPLSSLWKTRWAL